MEKCDSFDSIDMLVAQQRMKRKTSFHLGDSFDGRRSPGARSSLGSPGLAPVSPTVGGHLRKSAKSGILKRRQLWKSQQLGTSGVHDYAKMVGKARPPLLEEHSALEFSAPHCGMILPPHEEVVHGNLVLTSELGLHLLETSDSALHSIALLDGEVDEAQDLPESLGITVTLFTDATNVMHIESSGLDVFVLLPVSLAGRSTNTAHLLLECLQNAADPFLRTGAAVQSPLMHPGGDSAAHLNATMPVGFEKETRRTQKSENFYKISEKFGGGGSGFFEQLERNENQQAQRLNVNDKPSLRRHAEAMEWGATLQVLLGLRMPDADSRSKQKRDGSRRNTLWDLSPGALSELACAEPPALFRYIPLAEDETNVDKYDRLHYLYALEGRAELSDLYQREGSLHDLPSGLQADWRYRVTDLLEHVTFLEKTTDTHKKGVRQLLEVQFHLQKVLEEQLAPAAAPLGEKLCSSTVALLNHTRREIVRLQALETTRHFALLDAASRDAMLKTVQ